MQVTRTAVLQSGRVYYRLIVSAADPNTEIWLGDDKGYFVQKETGTLDTGLLPGNYSVEFGLGSTQYPITLRNDSRFTQAELEKGPTCDYQIKDPPEDLDHTDPQDDVAPIIIVERAKEQ